MSNEHLKEKLLEAEQKTKEILSKIEQIDDKKHIQENEQNDKVEKLIQWMQAK